MPPYFNYLINDCNTLSPLSKYRTLTGWCNNLLFPEYGKSIRAFTRLLAPAYDDGLMSPRSRNEKPQIKETVALQEMFWCITFSTLFSSLQARLFHEVCRLTHRVRP